ncbi:radical SAM/SPASM domain-containing protein [Youngiibacter multivorans]|uniref:Radical SAM protein with 4Fe4S-binding SPASM domain n=1 Tax=Youngiibacter multivorans TaxID=937251 RepID=A0ABS4G4G0_9CLOT|nr:radical SAM protein [Youngiibacter multivorans]MBP1919438.1 radical SAM protein with 4Fe4S-binding SPASM domain [Youngiibacter multivorans]
MNNFAIELTAPTSVDITITKKCNHRCIHCYNVWRNDNENSEIIKRLSDEQIEKLKNELILNNIWRATLTGGEPLAEIDILYKLIRVLNESGIALSMNTNLSLMTDTIASKLVHELKWTNIVLTSLPGLVPETCDDITQIRGSYKNIIRGIDICQKHGIPVGINVVISKKNIKDLELIFDFITQHKVDFVSITRAIAPLYDRDNPDFFLSEDEIIYIADVLEHLNAQFGISVGSITPFPLCILKDISKYKNILSASCAAGISRCSIDAITGDISACTHEEKSYGNIYSDGLQSAWSNMYEWRNGLLINEECRNCDKVAYCGGECRMIAGTEVNVKYNLNKSVEINYQPYMSIPQITKDTVFLIAKNVRYRREPFGGILRCKENECYVKENIIVLYEKIKNRTQISLNEFLEFCEESEYLYNAILELEKMKILVRQPV